MRELPVRLFGPTVKAKSSTFGYLYLGGACGVMVIVVGNGHGDMSSNPGKRLTAFHIALIPLGKV